jgi:predicted Zn-dependent protease
MVSESFSGKCKKTVKIIKNLFLLQILSSDPDNLGVMECLTRAHIMLENEVEAERCLDVLRRKSKSTAAIALLSSLCLKKQNKVEEAVEELDAAVLQEPSSAELWLELGKLHWENKRYSLSLTALLKVAEY